MGEGPGVRSGFGEGFLFFREACSPQLPMGEGPGVRALGEAHTKARGVLNASEIAARRARMEALGPT